MTMSTSRSVEVESNLTEGVSNEESEMNRILQATESPLSTYARFLSRIERSDPLRGRWKADKIRVWKPVTEYVKGEILYRRKIGSHIVCTINGETGSLKSFSALSLANMIDLNGFWRINSKGECELPKIFWSVPNMLRYVRDYAVEGDCILLDEEIHRGGVGCVSSRTPILLSNGIQESIGELYRTMKNVPLVALDFAMNKLTGAWGQILKTGRKMLYRVEFNDGSYDDVTLDHRFFMRNGERIVEKRLYELKEGNEIIGF